MSPRARYAVRVVGLALPLFVYTAIGFLKSLPVPNLVIQAGVLVVLAAWWMTLRFRLRFPLRFPLRFRLRLPVKLPYSFPGRLRGRGLAVTPLNLPLVTYLAAVTLATLFSTDARTSLDALLTVAALVLFYFLFCDLLLAGWGPRIFIDVLLVVVGLFLVEALGFLAVWAVRWLLLSVPAYPTFLIPPQLYGVAEHPNLLAGLINLALPFAILRLAEAVERPRLGEGPAPSTGDTSSGAVSDAPAQDAVGHDAGFVLSRALAPSVGGTLSAAVSDADAQDAGPFGVRLVRGAGWGARRDDILRVYGAQIGWAVWLLAATVVLFYTSSRAGWLASLTVVGVTVAWLASRLDVPARAGWRARLRAGRGVWLTLGAYLAVFLLLATLNSRASTAEYAANAGGVSAGRGVLWRVAWDSFLARPLTGTGPLTYTRQYTDAMPFERANSYTPNHAHNILLNTLSQEGLIGALALAWVVGMGVWVCLRTWGPPLRLPFGSVPPKAAWDAAQGASIGADSVAGPFDSVPPKAGRDAAQGAFADVRAGAPLLVGASAALAGFLVHSQLDVISWLPSIGLIVVLLASLAMHAAGEVRAGVYPAPHARVARALVVLACVALPIFFVRDYTARHALAKAIRGAENGEWMATTYWLKAAVSADPRNIHYLRQRAYVYGVRAAPQSGPGDGLALDEALDAYDALFEVQDSWVPDLLNAGMLNQLAGNEGEAQRLFEAAAPRWQGWPLPVLLLGDSYARQGRREEARQLFVEALTRNARAADTVACLQNPLCREQAADLPQPDGAIGSIHQEASRLLGEGASAEALLVLQDVPVATRSALIWIDRAEAHIALGQVREGRYALEVAATLDAANSPDTAARLALLRAELLMSAGRRDAAISALERALRPRFVVLPYDMIHRQSSMPGLFVPRLSMLERTVDDMAAYKRLGQFYQLADRPSDARWADQRATALTALILRSVSEAGGP